MAEVTDLRDTRVLIPRVRRSIEGPDEAGFGGSAGTPDLTDDEVNALVADAVADVILYSGGHSVFGYILEIAERDDYYMAPTAYRTDTEMSLEAQSVIAAQAALNHFTHTLKTLKTSERIADEGQEWEYQIGATVLTEQIKGLREDRDKALKALAGNNVVAEDYINFLAVRDSYTDSLIEPWSDGGLGRGGQNCDPRFGGF